MKYLKRILCLIIVFNMLLQGAAFAADKTENEISSDIKLLEVLNIISFPTYNDEAVSRAEFTDIVIKSFGYKISDDTKKNAYFTDIELSNIYYGSISAAAEMGWISGYENGRFYPDGKMKTQFAIGMIIKAMCGSYADKIGESLKAELFNGIKCGEYIDRKSTVRLIMNMLEAYAFDTVDLSNIKKSEKTMLENIFSVYKVKGIIKATDRTALFGGKTAPDGYFYIDDNLCRATDSAVGDYIGQSVLAYIRETDDEWELVSLSPSEKNTIVKIDADDISDKTTSKSIVYNVGNSEKNVNISVADVIYNDELLDEYSSGDLKIENGSILAIDNNSDSVYEVVVVKAYTDYVVDSVDTIGKKLYFMYNRPEFDMSKDKYFITDSDGDEVSYLGLKKYNVLSVYESKTGKSDKIFAEKSDKEPVFGKISAIRYYDGNKIVKINDAEYEVDGFYEKYSLQNPDKAPKTDIGLESTFYLTQNGKISAVSTEINDGNFYGYLAKAVYDEENEKLLIGIFDESGVYKLYESNEKISVNGIKTKQEDTLKNELFYKDYPNIGKKLKPQIVKFELQNGKIKSLLLAGESDDFTVLNSGKINFYRVRRGKVFVDERNDGNLKYFCGNNTRIFNVPEYNGGDVDVDALRVSNPSAIRGDGGYDAILYDVDKITGEIGCIEFNEMAEPEWYGNVFSFVITDIVKGVNSDEELTDIINGVRADGSKASYYLREKDNFLSDYNLHAGDIVGIITNSKNEVVNMRKMFTTISPEEDVNKGTFEKGHTAYAGIYTKQPLTKSGEYTADYCEFASVYGVTIGKTDGHMILKTNLKTQIGTVDKEYRYPVMTDPNMSIFNVDYTGRKPEVSVGSLSDIREEGTEILMDVCNFFPNAIYIIHR